MVCSDGSRGLAKEAETLKTKNVVAAIRKHDQEVSNCKKIILQLQEKLLTGTMGTIQLLFSVWSKLER